MSPTFTALISGGLIQEEDGKLMYIQGLSLEGATAVAEWLAVATGSKVRLRHQNPLRGLDLDILRCPSDIKWTTLSDMKEQGAS